MRIRNKTQGEDFATEQEAGFSGWPSCALLSPDGLPGHAPGSSEKSVWIGKVESLFVISQYTIIKAKPFARE